MIGTDDLRSEHVAVGRMPAIVSVMAGRVQGGEPVDAADVDAVVEFLRVFVDKCHHTKEEQLLFPAMRAAGTSAEDTIVRLLDDHVHGREFVGSIAAASGRLAEGDQSAAGELTRAMTGYTELLHAHIRREENDCFDVADRELADGVQEELLEGYERVEQEVVGGGVHERFHALIDRLGHTYAA
jgi:hemerythrin-like domain-containing protein